MPESIQEPPHKKEHREAFLLNTDPVEQWMLHEIMWARTHQLIHIHFLFEVSSLEFGRIRFVNIFIMLKVEQ